MLQLPNFAPFRSNGKPYSSYMSFGDKCMEWLQKDIEHWKVKGTPYVLHKYPMSIKFHPISLYD